MPLWPWLGSMMALECWDELPGELFIVSSSVEGASVAVQDDSANDEFFPLEDTWSLDVAREPLVCPDEKVTNSWACTLESPKSLEEGSTET